MFGVCVFLQMLMEMLAMSEVLFETNKKYSMICECLHETNMMLDIALNLIFFS